MTEPYASVAIGTGATLLAALLLLLRAQFQGRRPFVALTRRWVAASARSSVLVVGLLFAIAAFSFATIPARDVAVSNSSVALDTTTATHDTALDDDGGSGPDQELSALQAYADKVDAKPQSTSVTSQAADSVALPDVETMIAQLVSRLEKQPGDVRGWKMLGWSYINTNRPDDAVRAYETALTLEPNDDEIKKGLEQAKTAQTAGPSAAGSAAEPVTSDKGAAGPIDAQQSSMIRGMVDRLATRLETSPNDEDGWLRLMRSRMTLGEKDAAKAALSKALATFASDEAAKARITTAARELGVESN